MRMMLWLVGAVTLVLLGLLGYPEVHQVLEYDKRREADRELWEAVWERAKEEGKDHYEEQRRRR